MFIHNLRETGAMAFALWLILMGPAWGLEKPEFLNPNYIKSALSGDLSGMLETLEAAPDNDQNRELLARFRARFIDRTDGLDLKAEDPFVRAIGERYQQYWRDTLLDPGKREALEKDLGCDIVGIMTRAGYGGLGLSTENYQQKLPGILREKGYHGIFGRTPPLLDFMVWKTHNTKQIPVELTTWRFDTTVHFLDDFVSFGWAYFADFGGPSTGGWADDEGLYIVTPKWNVDSEAFQVSYLKHETRHFADYQKYPNLQPADLEYRAKLTELSFGVEDIYSLLEKFTKHAAKVKDAPHPLANWHVITNLSKRLLGTTWPESHEAWQGVPVNDIHAAAKELLAENTNKLDALGANKTRGIINP